ncbi:dihydropteroate synthase [Treponema parvum]|uniref:dihydropteroate synthase n=1 Tax=Treponema parvum TaxID=138851 RepID=A0A975F3U6_9SPIR|nr:dihydropteroate synthase [Treponema parvum]QTQ14149.1 dihydropteroate synthase [Treponema parvum]
MTDDVKKLCLSDRSVSTENAAFVMGIVNATSDSFWEGSRGGIDRALSLIDEGADILDIGGESTRPGSEYVDADEEIKRIVPLIEHIRRFSDIPISVDTRKSEVMKAAFSAGADMLNDVSALEDDEELAGFVASVKIPLILMQKKGDPAIMQKGSIHYDDVTAEVSAYLTSRAEYAMQAGISSKKIIIDPGIGFGKDLEANIALIKNCGKLCDGRYPVLMALSRKTCIGQITGRSVEDRLFGTIAADVIAVLAGAFMIRVHDVAAAVDSMKILKTLE